MSKVVSLVADAVKIAQNEFGAKYFIDPDEIICTADDVVRKWADADGSIEVDADGMIDESGTMYGYLNDIGISREYADIMLTKKDDDPQYEIFLQEMREFAALMCIDSDGYDALGSSIVQDCLSNFEHDFVGSDIDDVAGNVSEKLAEFWGRGAVATIGSNDCILSASFGQNIGGEILAIICNYGDWYAVLNGSKFYPIYDHDVTSMLERYAEYFAERVNSKY